MNRIDELQEENKHLSFKIEQAERNNDPQRLELKKQLYQNKIELINLITLEEQRAGITAQQLIEMVDAMPPQPKYSIGIDAIDRELASWEDKQHGVVGGIETGSFINLAGESGAGKTTLTIDILANVSRYSKTVFFNHEMGIRRMANRLKRRLTERAQRDNMIIDSSTDKIDDLIMEITLYARDGIKFFVIDSRMKLKGHGDSDVQRNSDISHKLSKVAREKDIIVILINQMSESDIKEKRLALKGGGDAKYDSDMVLFYVKNDSDNSKRKLVCVKNRTGDERLWSAELTVRNGVTCGINTAADVVYEHKDKIDTGGFIL